MHAAILINDWLLIIYNEKGVILDVIQDDTQDDTQKLIIFINDQFSNL